MGFDLSAHLIKGPLRCAILESLVTVADIDNGPRFRKGHIAHTRHIEIKDLTWERVEVSA